MALAPHIIRDRLLGIRLREHEHSLIHEAAERANERPSEWARRRLLVAAQVETAEQEHLVRKRPRNKPRKGE